MFGGQVVVWFVSGHFTVDMILNVLHLSWLRLTIDSCWIVWSEMAGSWEGGVIVLRMTGHGQVSSLLLLLVRMLGMVLWLLGMLMMKGWVNRKHRMERVTVVVSRSVGVGRILLHGVDSCSVWLRCHNCVHGAGTRMVMVRLGGLSSRIATYTMLMVRL